MESSGINISDGEISTITASRRHDTITPMSTSDAHAMTVRLPKPLLDVVDDHWHGNRFQSRHAAVLDLLWKGSGQQQPAEASGDQFELDLQIPGVAR